MSRKQAPYREVAQVLRDLPTIVRESRRARSVTTRTLGSLTGLAPSTITRIEHGEPVALASAVAVIDWLDQTPTPRPARQATLDVDPQEDTDEPDA